MCAHHHAHLTLTLFSIFCTFAPVQLQAAVVKAVGAQKRLKTAKLALSVGYNKGTVQRGVKYFCNFLASIHPTYEAGSHRRFASPPRFLPLTTPSPAADWSSGEEIFEKWTRLDLNREALLSRYCNPSQPDTHVTPFDCQIFLEVCLPTFPLSLQYRQYP